MPTVATRVLSVTAMGAMVAVTCLPSAAAQTTPEWESPSTVAEMVPADAAVARTGEMAVALRDADEVYVARRAVGADWGAPESLGAGGWPQVEYDRAGHVVAAWSDSTDSGMTIYSRRTLDDGTWGPVEVVATRATGEASYVQLAVSPSGAALVDWVWTTLDRGRLFVSSRPAVGTWTAPTRLGPAGMAEQALGVAGDAAVVVSTIQARGDRLTEVLTLFRRSPDGVWGAGEEITRLPDITFLVGMPDVAVDRFHRTTVVWRDQADDGRWQVLAGRARPGAAVHVAKVVAPDTGPAYESGPQVVSNPDGEVQLVTWTRADGALNGRRWLEGGPWDDWGPIVALAPETDDVLFWSTAMERNGRAVAVWTRGGWFGTDGLGVQARRMNRRGAWGLTAQVAPTGARVLEPLAGKGANDSLAVWWQRRPGDRWVTRAAALLVE